MLKKQSLTCTHMHRPIFRPTHRPTTSFSDMRNWILTAHVVLKVDDDGSDSGVGGRASGVVLKCDDEERTWSEGCAPTVIDTTFRHETWNRGTLALHIGRRLVRKCKIL